MVSKMGLILTKVDSFEFKVVLSVARKQVAFGLAEWLFTRVAVWSVDGYEHVGIRATSKLIPRLYHDVVVDVT